ncbi:MAG: hypothetical protein WD711_10275 [Dongiaceae bacterium]
MSVSVIRASIASFAFAAAFMFSVNAYADAADYLPDIVRLEKLALTDPAAAGRAAQTIKSELDQQFDATLAEAARFSNQAAQWRALADDAGAEALAAGDAAKKSAVMANEPQLSSETRAVMAADATRFEATAEEHRARAAGYTGERVRLTREAEVLRDEAALYGELIVRLGKMIAPVAVAKPESAGEAVASGEDEIGASEESSQPERDVWEVLGLWHSTASHGELVIAIVLEDPNTQEPYPDRIQAHTDARVWQGRFNYHPPEHPGFRGDPLAVFHYTPTAEEMNPAMPEWVRNAVEGTLRWRLEIDAAGTEIDPLLSVKWFRGLVHWTETDGARTAWVEGDGIPLVFEMEPDISVQVAELHGPVLNVRLETGNGVGHDPALMPIDRLLKGQRFFVTVTLPAVLAREQGPNLTVSFEALGSGGETSIELTRAGPVDGRPAIYSDPTPVSFGECHFLVRPQRDPQVMSVNWIYSVPGDCLDLDLVNRETVRISFGEAKQEIIVYNSWTQLGIEQHQIAADKLEILFRSIQLGDYSAEQRLQAGFRLEMLANYRLLMASPLLTDLHRFAIGGLYFGSSGIVDHLVSLSMQSRSILDTAFDRSEIGQSGLLELSYDQISTVFDFVRSRPPPLPKDASYLNPQVLIILESAFGVGLAIKAPAAALVIDEQHTAERYLVAATLKFTSEDFLRAAVKRTIADLTFGFYEGFAAGVNTDQLYLVITGLDLYNRRKSGWDRIAAAVGIASDLILLHPNVGLDALNDWIPVISRHAEAIPDVMEFTLVTQRGVTRQLDGLQDLDGLPLSLTSAQRQQTVLQATSEIADFHSLRCAPLGDQPAKPSSHLFNPDRELLQFQSDLDYLQGLYGADASFVDPFGEAVFPRQTYPATCNAVAANYLIQLGTGRLIKEEEAILIIRQVMIDQLKAPPNTKQAGRRVAMDLAQKNGIANGFDQFAIRDYLRQFGAVVVEMEQRQNYLVKVRHIMSALEQGYFVKVVINVGRSQGQYLNHAVIVRRLEFNPSTQRIIAVHVFDPSVGRIVRVPARQFKAMLARSSNFGIVTFIKFKT